MMGRIRSASIPRPELGAARIAATSTYTTLSSASRSERDLKSTGRLYTELPRGAGPRAPLLASFAIRFFG